MQAPDAGPQPWEQKAPRGRKRDRKSPRVGGAGTGVGGPPSNLVLLSWIMKSPHPGCCWSQPAAKSTSMDHLSPV